jgi:hypothetical protein
MKKLSKKTIIIGAIGLIFLCGIISSCSEGQESGIKTPTTMPDGPTPSQTLRPSSTPLVTNAPTRTPVPTKIPTIAPSVSPTIQPTQPQKAATLPIIQPTTPPAAASKCPNGCTAQQSGCDIKGNINGKDKIYHVPGSSSYANTKIEPEKGERWFCTIEEAQANGWRAPLK